MKNRVLSSSIFIKYLISYFIILLIPIVFTLLFTYSYFINIFKDEIITNNANMLEYIRNKMDYEIHQLKIISNEIQTNSKLTTYSINNSTIGKMSAINELKNYSIRSDLIEKLILYIYDDKYLYTSSGTYTINSFTDVYKYNGWSYDEFRNILNSNSSSGLISENIKYSELKAGNSAPGYIAYTQPLPSNSMYPSMSILFLLKEDTIKSSISDVIKMHNANTLILDNNYKIITCTKNADYLSKININSILHNKTGNSGIIAIDKVKYYYLYMKSGITKWTFLTLIPEKDALQYVFDVRKRSIYVMVSIFLFGSLIIYLLVNYNYNPIKQLKEFADRTWDKNQDTAQYKTNDDGYSNEIEAIKSIIGQMHKNDENLRIRIKDSVPAVKEFLLKMLLQGRFSSIEEFNNTAKDANLAFTKPCYRVILVSSEKYNTVGDKIPKNDILKYIENYFIDFTEVYGIDNFEGNNLIFIIASEKLNPGQFKETLLLLQKAINDIWGLYITIGAGGLHTSHENIPQSYIQASVAIDYSFVLGKNKVIFFDEINNSQKDMDYPINELKDLPFYMKQGDTGKIVKSLESIIYNINKNNAPLFMVRCVCYDIINTVIKTMNQLDIGIKSISNNYFDAFSSCDTADKLIDTIKELCIDVCDIISMSKESCNSNLREKVLEYLSTNCEDLNFSVKIMAQDLDVSQSYLSRFFKDQIGITITDYIMLQRIEKAKHLLKTTNEPLRNIITEIGYFSEASFVRMFKRVEGITPGEYRKLISCSEKSGK